MNSLTPDTSNSRVLRGDGPGLLEEYRDGTNDLAVVDTMLLR